ncbi:hypothetical protein BDR26DRAFT_901983 [Obelidium mucronatum]|nr:hypothetical protein BDR26DRAFT_901983 [Obelidium mucronatum]
MSFIDEARAVVVLANKLRKVKPFLHRYKSAVKLYGSNNRMRAICDHISKQFSLTNETDIQISAIAYSLFLVMQSNENNPAKGILPSAPISTTPVPSKGKRRVAASTTGGSSGPKPKRTSRAQQPLAMQPSVAEETRLATPVVPLIALQSSVNAGYVGPSRIPVVLLLPHQLLSHLVPLKSLQQLKLHINRIYFQTLFNWLSSHFHELEKKASLHRCSQSTASHWMTSYNSFWFTVTLGLALGCLFIPPTTPDGKCTFSLANTQRDSISVADLSHFLKWIQDSSKDALGLLNSLTIEVLNEKRTPGHSITFHLIKHSYNITSKELYEAAVVAVLKNQNVDHADRYKAYTFDWDR